MGPLPHRFSHEEEHLIAAALVSWTFGCLAVTAWACLRSRRVDGASAAAVGAARVTVLRPCAGAEDALDEALASSSAVDACARIRFLVASPDDAATPTAARMAAVLASLGRDASVVVTGATRPNRKADQLGRALALEPHDDGARNALVLVADSDVVLRRALVSALLEPIITGRADAVWAPPIEPRPSTVADRISAAVLDASLHSFALLSALDRGGMVGKVFAVRRDALEQCGGFEGLTGYLGEDMELGRRLRRRGFRVVAASEPAPSLASGRSLRAVVARYARWLAVVRGQRAALLASYPLLLAAAPLQIATGSLALVGGAPLRPLILALSATAAARWATAVAARLRLGLRPWTRDLAWAPWVADVVLLWAFVACIGSRTVRWRGVALRVGRRGALIEVPR